MVFMNEDKIEMIRLSFTTEIMRDITKILEIYELNLNSLKNYLNELKNRDKEKILGFTINEQLTKIKDVITINDYKKISSQVDEITKYYTLDNNISKGNDIASKILCDVIGNKITLPISIIDVKKYYLLNDIDNEYINDVLILIIVRYYAVKMYYDWINGNEK